MEALQETGKRNLQGELGPYAPAPQRVTALAERVGHTGELVARAEALVAHAREADQIALSDALALLEKVRKQYLTAVEYNTDLEAYYRSLVKLFEMRSGAIAEGIARAKNGAPAKTGEAAPTHGASASTKTPSDAKIPIVLP